MLAADLKEAMSSLANKLRAASDDLGSVGPTQLVTLLRRAALRLDTTSFPAGEQTTIRADILAAVDKVASKNDLTREFMVAAILRDWLIGHGVQVDGPTDTKGSA